MAHLFLEYKYFVFEEREVEITDELFDSVLSLDGCITVMSKEEIEEYLMGVSFDAGDEKSEEEIEDESDEEPEEEIEEEEEEELPKKKSKRKTSKKKTTKKKNKCPHGHTFGEDIDEYEKDCTECEVWDECNDAS